MQLRPARQHARIVQGQERFFVAHRNRHRERRRRAVRLVPLSDHREHRRHRQAAFRFLRKVRKSAAVSGSKMVVMSRVSLSSHRGSIIVTGHMKMF